MDPQTRRLYRRMKSHRRRTAWRRNARLERALAAIERRLSAIEARGTPLQWQQLFNDILNIFSATGQTASVVRVQAEQIQALAEAFTRLSVAVKSHDETSLSERAAIMDMVSGLDVTIVSLVEVARQQVHLAHDIARAVGAELTPSEKRRANKKPSA